jgi:hypothetical protein
VSFQVTILKVLAGQPEGYLPLAELRNNVAILISSGPDWTDRTKRIAARTPGLDIFSQGMVLRSSGGWRITDAGRAFLAECEVPISSHSQELGGKRSSSKRRPPLCRRHRWSVRTRAVGSGGVEVLRIVFGQCLRQQVDRVVAYNRTAEQSSCRTIARN